MKMPIVRRSDHAREIASEMIFEGLGLDVEDLSCARVERGVGVWVDMRVLITEERIEQYLAARRRKRSRR